MRKEGDPAMQSVLISCDFLLAPAYCSTENIENTVINLVEFTQSMDALKKQPLLEINAMQKLLDRDDFPCESLFNKNISRNLEKKDDAIYTGKDIARIVNKILSCGIDFDYESTMLWDCDKKNISPTFSGKCDDRVKELEKIIEEVSIYSEIENVEMSILHFCEKDIFKSVDFSATINTTEPEISLKLPHTFTKTTKLFSDYRHHLADMPTSIHLVNENSEIATIKEIIYCEALAGLHRRGESLKNISFNNFEIGHSFLASLKNNQCLYGQKFFGPCLASIVSALTNDPAYEISIFSKSEKPEEQRSHGEFYGYRCHVTKGGPALRLMFWRKKDGFIELANVGPKHELKIEMPN